MEASSRVVKGKGIILSAYGNIVRVYEILEGNVPTYIFLRYVHVSCQD